MITRWISLCGVLSLFVLCPSLPSGSGALAAQRSNPDELVSQAQATTAPSDAYFYRDRPGSDQYVGPLDVVLNKGFNFAQAQNRERSIFTTRYGVRHVWSSVVHPISSIESTDGWGQFFKEQILPIQAVNWIRSGFDWSAADNMTWYPNYMGHFVEGGITSRRLAEKLRAQGVPYASAIAGATTMLTAALNEAYTHPVGLEDGSAATVADLYVFDLGGVLAFSFDPVARFFAETLHAQVWSSQAAVTLPDFELANNANNLIFKIPLPFVDRASLFFRTAVGSHLGATIHLDDGYDLSIGLGADASRQNIDPVTGDETVDIRMSSSIYLDRGGSVLASLYLSQVKHRRLAVNVYPGVLDDDFGGWLAVTHDGAFQFGLSHRLAQGLSLGARVR